MSSEPRSPEPTEETLMSAYVKGDRQAFMQLFSSLAPRIHRFFLASFRSAAIADDLLQTTFLLVHRGRQSYRAGEALRPWIFRIAANVRTDEFRRRARTQQPLQPLHETSDEKLAAPVDTQHVAAADEEAQHIRTALDALPEKPRAILHLYHYEGFNFREIGEMLGIPEGTARVTAFRAHQQLREKLSGVIESSHER